MDQRSRCVCSFIPDSSNQTVNTHTKNIMSFIPQVLFMYASTNMRTRGLLWHSQCNSRLRSICSYRACGSHPGNEEAIDQQNKLKKVLKFQYEELSAAICDFIINCKPLQIKAAIEVYGFGSPQARAAGSLLILGPDCLPRATRHELDSLTQIVSTSLERFAALFPPNQLTTNTNVNTDL